MYRPVKGRTSKKAYYINKSDELKSEFYLPGKNIYIFLHKLMCLCVHTARGRSKMPRGYLGKRSRLPIPDERREGDGVHF